MLCYSADLLTPAPLPSSSTGRAGRAAEQTSPHSSFNMLTLLAATALLHAVSALQPGPRSPIRPWNTLRMTAKKFSYDPAVGITVEPMRFRKCTKQLSTLGMHLNLSPLFHRRDPTP